MRHVLWPRSLRGQMIVLVLIGLGMAQGLGFVISRVQYQSVLRSLRDEYVLTRMASVVRLLADTPLPLHERIVHAANSRALELTLSHESILETSTPSRRCQRLRQQLASLTDIDSADIRIGLRPPGTRRPKSVGGLGPVSQLTSAKTTAAPVAVDGTGGRQPQQRSGSPEARNGRVWHQDGVDAWPAHKARHLQRQARATVLAVAVRLDDGRWLNAVSKARPRDPFWQWPTLLSVGLTALILSALMVLMVQRITGPLARLAAAADRFGRGEATSPLAEAGPADIRHTIRAFNRMRERLERFVQDRTRMLAAISHDLRTPITALRLRAELIEDGDMRDKIIDTLDEMQRMTEATLVFVREEAAQEDARLIDLAALIESLCDDLSDMGKPVTFRGPGKTPYRCRSVSLKRAISNLLENAVIYGQRGRVRLAEEDDALWIDIDDDGPGIAEPDMARVFEPFVRLETSRSRDTGGVGLGMAIARSIVRSHGGDISLANRPEGGLRVTVRLPKDDPSGAKL